MAITINQQPTTPNLANADLLYSVSSNRSSSPQYQFVIDIKDANNTLIQRIKQQPNPSGYGVFNVGQILSTQLGPTDNVWSVTESVANTACGKDFKVYFGEEYGSSVSSSVTLYSGNSDVVGAPAKTGSQYYFNLDGHLNPNDAVDWNWNSGSKYDEELTDDITFSHQNGLTSFDTSSVYAGDYHTISFLNGNLDGVAKTGSAQDIFSYYIKEYDSSGVLISSSLFYNTAGPRPFPYTGSTWVNVYTSQSQATRLVHIPCGPQNLADAGFSLDSSTSVYNLTVNAQATDGFTNDNGVFGEYRFEIGECSGFEPVRFAWKNEYGVWDYYNFTKATNRTSNISRESYNQTFVDFSTTSTSVSYDRARRGRTNYYNEITKNRQANSDWLSQTDADNLREMFFSTNVYVYHNSSWIPVVITDANITEKTNNLSQKTFQYSVNYNHANEVRPRI